MKNPPRSRTIFGPGSWPEVSRISEILRKETVGGVLLLVAAAASLVWVNSPWASAYVSLGEYKVGHPAVHLDLSLAAWAADGLLAIFFFVVGLELKREFVAGDLRDPQRAALPITAAIGGMVFPALVYVAVNANAGGGALRGWAIPTATDIAFALAILAVVNTHLPTALRTFLLTLAVVDDLLAVTIIAVFYTSDLDVLPLLGALVPLALFAFAVHRRIRTWWILLPLALMTWGLVHESGVHATVAGVLLGFAVPVARNARDGQGDGHGLAEHFEHRFRPLSAIVAVPIFAFFAAGVTIGGLRGLGDALTDSVALGIVLGLVAGKTIGIFGTTYLLARFTRARLDSTLRWLDVLGVSVLAGIGFTVSLLIGDLAFGIGTERDAHVKIGVLTGSVLASLLAAVILRLRDKAHQRIQAAEATDSDADGIPDIYE
ncbi:Na+/H+ antiporter NhaA [Aeromicrobium sp.]